MQVEETLKDDRDVEPSGTERFEMETKDVHDLLRIAMQKEYCYAHNSEFQDTAEEHNDWLGEAMRESVNLF